MSDTTKPKRRGTPNPNKTSKAAIAAQDRRLKALELRREGYGYDHIAKTLGFSCRGAAYKTVSAAIKEITREPAEEVLRLELERLDKLLASTFSKATSAATEDNARAKAIASCLAIMERRAKFLGLDSPTKMDHSNEDGSLRPTVIRLVAPDLKNE